MSVSCLDPPPVGVVAVSNPAGRQVSNEKIARNEVQEECSGFQRWNFTNFDRDKLKERSQTCGRLTWRSRKESPRSGNCHGGPARECSFPFWYSSQERLLRVQVKVARVLASSTGFPTKVNKRVGVIQTHGSSETGRWRNGTQGSLAFPGRERGNE